MLICLYSFFRTGLHQVTNADVSIKDIEDSNLFNYAVTCKINLLNFYSFGLTSSKKAFLIASHSRTSLSPVLLNMLKPGFEPTISEFRHSSNFFYLYSHLKKSAWRSFFKSIGCSYSLGIPHGRFCPTTAAYSKGKFLPNVAQQFYRKSAWYGRAGIQTHDPVVEYVV